MTINIRNDKGDSVAFIEVKDGIIVEETLKGCFISDIDGNDDGSCRYRLDIITSEEFVEGLSNETLLDEIKNRMS